MLVMGHHQTTPKGSSNFSSSLKDWQQKYLEDSNA